MVLLDARLQRIEEMLLTVSPSLSKKRKRKGLANRSLRDEMLQDISDEESNYEGEEEGDEDEDDDDDEDDAYYNDDEPNNDLPKPKNRSSSSAFKNNASDSDSQNSDYSDEAEGSATSRNKRRASKNGSSINLSFGVPASVVTTTVAGYGKSVSAYQGKQPDIINDTILNTSGQTSVNNAPLFFCTTEGVKWIMEITGETTILERFEASFKSIHLKKFETFRRACEDTDHPEPIDPQMLITCVREFKRFATSVELYDDEEEIDLLVANEVSNGGRGNGFAEKLALHSIIAIGLIAVQDRPHLLSPFPFKVDMKMIEKHIHYGYYYLFKFVLLGNSYMGVKSAIKLLISQMYTFDNTQTHIISVLVVRLAQTLGLHLAQFSKNVSKLESERRIRLWWTAYCIEKDYTLKFGRPSSILEESITTPLPTYTPELDSIKLNDDFCCLRSLVLLYRLWDRVAVTLHSRASNHLSVKEMLNKLIAFDKELIEWKEALPDEIKSGLNPQFAETLQHLTYDEMRKIKYFTIFAHTMHNFVLITIHRQIAYHPSWICKLSSEPKSTASPSSSKAAASSTDTDTSPAALAFIKNNNSSGSSNKDESSPLSHLDSHTKMKVVSRKIALDNPRLLNSFNIVIECSRNTILCLESWMKFPMDSFRLAFFLLNAFISLVIKCFIQPNAADAEEDLGLMQLTVDAFEHVSFMKLMMKEHSETFLHVLLDVTRRYVAKRKDAAAVAMFTTPNGSGQTTVSNAAAAVPPASFTPSANEGSTPSSSLPSPMTQQAPPRNVSFDSNEFNSRTTLPPPTPLSSLPSQGFSYGANGNRAATEKKVMYENGTPVTGGGTGGDWTSMPAPADGKPLPDILNMMTSDISDPIDPSIFESLYQLSGFMGPFDNPADNLM